MVISFSASKEIVWSRPAKCSKQFATRSIFIGSDEGDLGLEVCVAEWSASDTPPREAFLCLHKDRSANGIQPVVVLAVSGDRSWLFGPNPQAAVVGPLSVDHAQRILQSALSEARGLDARRVLTQTLDAIAATSSSSAGGDSLRGVGNAGLFATHELRHGVPMRPDWQEACASSREIITYRNDELVKGLGFRLEDLGGNASLLKSHGNNPQAVAVILLDNETFDANSNRFQVSPVSYGLAVAGEKEVSWLIVLRKDIVRLYPARLDMGVGRKGLAETYFELNLAVVDHTTAGFLSLIFSSEALAAGGTCFEILQSSAQYAVGLSERLRDKVYGEIVPRLSLAVASQLPALGVPMDRDGLNRAYQITLRIFFRMLFQAYADDRKLLPYGENADYTHNAIKGFAQRFVENAEIVFDEESSSYWDDLVQVWRAIDTGSKRFGIPAYNGGLFSSDEELQPDGALIEKLRLGDDVMGPVLRALLIDHADDGTFGPVDFRSLSVREFGTIYEGLLESNLAVAETDLVLDDNDAWVPAKKGLKLQPGRSAPKGSVYFHDTSGARKGTGSYFTPSFVVEHLLERSLDPSLDIHLDRVRDVLESGDQVGAADLFFDFKVADLAMGSAHFLTAAIDHIEQKMAGFLDTHPIPGITNELRQLEAAASEKLGGNAPVPEPSSLLRRQIARRCIYGLDINPVAVELARVSIWIHTFVRGLPMSSLDHNLVCGNSLTGIGTVEESLDALIPGRKGPTLFDTMIVGALERSRDILVEVSKASELDSKESKKASRASMKAYEDAREAKLIFDAAVLSRIGRGDLIDASHPEAISKRAASVEAQEAIQPLAPAHMPLRFPEVFMRKNGGFDVLIGNPPWEKMHVEEHQWWGLRHPGLRGLPMAERSKTIKKLQASRPDLVSEYENEVKATDSARRVIASGPYPGIGAGHVDLYKAFSWRNWQLLREGGSLGVVLPRGALNGSGTQKWRREVLEKGQFHHVVVGTNSRGWLFPTIHQQMTIALVVIKKASKMKKVRFAGSFHTIEEFEGGRDDLVEVTPDDFQTWTGTVAFPLLPDALAGEVFRTMRRHPAFSATDGFEFRPVQGDLNAATNKDLFNTNLAAARGDVPVLTGSSFNIWKPDYGDPYAYGSKKTIDHVLDKTINSSVQERSAFFGLGIKTVDQLPMNSPRIAFRDVTNATNTRTMLCCLVPPGVMLVHPAPYLVRRMGSEQDEAYLLGVMSSRVFDWYARRIVELHMTFELLDRMPVPRPTATDPLRQRTINIAGRLAAVDKRYSGWAKKVGVTVGTVTSDRERTDLEAELDALVAHLYGLSRIQLEHVFKTFHRGWSHTQYLADVLAHYDLIGGAQS